MGKPSLIYATDINEYEINNRKFACKPAYWPFSIATDNNSLIQNINSLVFEDYLRNINTFIKNNIQYDNGTSSKTLATFIYKKIS